MANLLDQELDGLLDAIDSRIKAKNEKKDVALTAEEIFIQEFTKVRAEVIRPTFEKLGKKVQARGHDYAITEGEYQPPSGGNPKPREAWIKITIFLSSDNERTRRGDVRRPYLMFQTDTRIKKACSWLSDYTDIGGVEYKENEFFLNFLSPLLIQEKFLMLWNRLANK